jgi:hypothetical protein
MMTITRVGPLSVAKIAGLLGVVVGLIGGAFVSLFSLAGAALGAGAGDDSAIFGAFLGVGAIVLLPIFYGCMAFVITLIQAALFNIAVGLVGGIEIEAR